MRSTRERLGAMWVLYGLTWIGQDSRVIERPNSCSVAEATMLDRTQLPRFPSVVDGIDTMDVKNLLEREMPINISHTICLGTQQHQKGERRRDLCSAKKNSRPSDVSGTGTAIQWKC